ncbi:hypothetical protein L208DRAFT_1411836, partial [Tricholoma matsutake]
MSTTTMKAVCFHAPRNLEIITKPIPQVESDQVLIKVTCCGMCGSDHHFTSEVRDCNCMHRH